MRQIGYTRLFLLCLIWYFIYLNEHTMSTRTQLEKAAHFELDFTWDSSVQTWPSETERASECTYIRTQTITHRNAFPRRLKYRIDYGCEWEWESKREKKTKRGKWGRNEVKPVTVRALYVYIQLWCLQMLVVLVLVVLCVAANTTKNARE